MKKTFRAFSCLLLALSMFNLSFAGMYNASGAVSDETIETFDFDENEVYGQFDEIDELSELVTNSDVTYSELENENSRLLVNVNSANMIPVPVAQDDMEPPVFSGFLWGCIFGIVGVVLVYVTTADDSPHRRKAITGCVVSGVISAGITVAYYVWIAAATSNLYY